MHPSVQTRQSSSSFSKFLDPSSLFYFFPPDTPIHVCLSIVREFRFSTRQGQTRLLHAIPVDGRGGRDLRTLSPGSSCSLSRTVRHLSHVARAQAYPNSGCGRRLHAGCTLHPSRRGLEGHIYLRDDGDDRSTRGARATLSGPVASTVSSDPPPAPEAEEGWASRPSRSGQRQNVSHFDSRRLVPPFCLSYLLEDRPHGRRA